MDRKCIFSARTRDFFRGKLRQYLCALSLIFIAPASITAHSFINEINLLSDTQEGMLVNNRIYTVGELKVLVSMRTFTRDNNQSLVLGLNELIRAGETSISYSKLAESARERGLEVTESETKTIEERIKDYQNRLLFAMEVEDKIGQPTQEQIKELYTEEKESFRVKEKIILREIIFPFEDEEGKKAAITSAEKVYERLESGEPFARLQREVHGPSNTRIQVLTPEEDSTLSPRLLDAFRDLSDKVYTEPIETDEGIHIIYRQLYIPPNYLPLESVQETLIDRWRSNRRANLIEEFFTGFTDSPDYWLIDGANLMNSGILATNKDVMVRIGDQEITRGELRNAAGWSLSPSIPMTPGLFERIATRTGVVQNALLSLYAEKEGLDNLDKISFFENKMRETFLARHELELRISERIGEPTGKELQDYYWRNRYQYRDYNRTVGRRLVISKEDAEIYKIPSRLDDVETLKDLEEFSSWLSENDINVDRVDYRESSLTEIPERHRNPLLRYVENQKLLYFEDESSMSIYWIEELTVPSEATGPLLEQVKKDWKEDRAWELGEKILNELKQDAAIDILLAVG